MRIHHNKKGQAVAPAVQPFSVEAFSKIPYTEIRWLGGAGALVNSRGTILTIDPVLSGFDMPLLSVSPIQEKDVPHLDGILLTHCDNDHYSRSTCRVLTSVTASYHAPLYVASLRREELGISCEGHEIRESFHIGEIKVTLTPAWQNWQKESSKHHTREFRQEDYCGFWLDTPDGSIWVVGDSRLLESQLQMPVPDAMLFDFSDSRWHIGLDGAECMAAAYPETPLILWHWGTVDAPEWKEFNGDPDVLKSRIVNSERVVVLAPGEPYRLKRL